MYKFFVFKMFYKYKNGKVSNLPVVSNQPRLPLTAELKHAVVNPQA